MLLPYSVWNSPKQMQPKGPFTQAIFAAIFLLLMRAIKWIDLRMY